MSGLNPPNILSYIGNVVVPFINRTFPPTTSFNDFNVPTIWIDTATHNAYILVAKPLGVADWILIGGAPGVLNTLTGNSGGAVAPTAGNIDFVGDGTTVDIVGNPGTSTLTVSAGGGMASLYTEDVGTAAPSAGNLNVLGGTGMNTSGATDTVTINLDIPVTVPHGGTNNTSFTAYSVICAGITSTGTFQNVVGVGTADQVLTSNGAAALPSWQTPGGALDSIVIQTFTANGTYTPTSGMTYCIVECLGGGGAGGGAPASGAQEATGGGGGSGEYARGVFSASDIGASKSVTIGSGGTGNSASTGGNGGNTSLDSLISANGGSGGPVSGPNPGSWQIGGEGGTGGSGGSFRTPGSNGLSSHVGAGDGISICGLGASSQYGSGGKATSTAVSGNAALGYGAGGGGTMGFGSSSALTGGAGTAGIIIITEYVG